MFLTRNGMTRSEATRHALLEMERLERRTLMRAEAEALKDDPVEQAASRALSEEKAEISAW